MFYDMTDLEEGKICINLESGLTKIEFLKVGNIRNDRVKSAE